MTMGLQLMVASNEVLETAPKMQLALCQDQMAGQNCADSK